MTGKVINIIKASGKIEQFSMDKLKASLKKSGAQDAVIEEIANEIDANLYEGITTRKIYQMAYSMLNKKHKPMAAKYRIKKAIMELGPSGFPFEKFIGVLLSVLGNKVKLNQILPGACVNHEVDIIAEDDLKTAIIECKYHNLQGAICDVKVPLYIHSRFRDLMANTDTSGKEYQCWIITNTRFSADALQYGNCAGLNLLCWDYPAKDNLKDLIDKYKLYPISCLTTITRREKELLLDQGIVLCRELTTKSDVLKEINVSEGRISNIISEAMSLANM
jgi:hypothetical protein